MPNRVLIAFVAFWTLCALAQGALAQEKRVALVLGNSAYQYTPPLTNPANDATDIAAELTKLGFDVIERMDLDKAAMDRTLRDFAEALSSAKVGLFFYAGHGIQVSGQNYLVPVDAKLSTPSAVDFEMVRLDLVQRTMESAASTNIIFIDACRDNPLARNLARALGTRSAQIGRGLSPQESGEGTLISFSTQPGNVALDGDGRNSPFADALIRHISMPGEDISTILINVRNDVMQATARRQVPWEHSALTARFFFLGKGQEVKVQAPAGDIKPPKSVTSAVSVPRVVLAPDCRVATCGPSVSPAASPKAMPRKSARSAATERSNPACKPDRSWADTSRPMDWSRNRPEGGLAASLGAGGACNAHRLTERGLERPVNRCDLSCTRSPEPRWVLPRGAGTFGSMRPAST